MITAFFRKVPTGVPVILGNGRRPQPRITLLSPEDPTRTITLRRAWIADSDRRFRQLMRDIRVSIVDNDALGLSQEEPMRTLAAARPGQFAFLRDAQKVPAFMAWLREQERLGVLELVAGPGLVGTEPWTNTYVRSSYQRGLAGANADLVAAGLEVPAFAGITRGIGQAFNLPFHADRLALAYTRTFTQLEGITAAMDQQISRILAEGLAEGVGPATMASRINNRVEKIGLQRARTLARTEVVQTLNQAALREFQRAELLIGEPINVLWQTALDERVRGTHRTRHGLVFTQAQGQLLIGEPNCRCALLPHIASVHQEPTLDEKRAAKTQVKKKREAAK